MNEEKCGYTAPGMEISTLELDFSLCTVSEGGTMSSGSGAEGLGENDFEW